MCVYIMHVLYIFRKIQLECSTWPYRACIYSADQLKKYGICIESAFYQALCIAL